MEAPLLLPWRDSNSHRRNQNPTCCHYTTRQFCLARSLFFAFALQSYYVFSNLANFFEYFFKKKFPRFLITAVNLLIIQ